jgi:hypothetical protein
MPLHATANLGRLPSDAHVSGAETAAAGQSTHDAHRSHAGGGTLSAKRAGQKRLDAHRFDACTAAAGQLDLDAQCTIAGGGTFSGMSS